jgi:hypothetical protein
MCDYSLQHVQSRPAAVGDKLTVKSFGMGTFGFACQHDPAVAVCVCGRERSWFLMIM